MYSKEEQLKRKPRKKRKSRPKSRTLTDLKKECWYWLSLAVRLHWCDRSGMVACVTTNEKRYYYKCGIDTGHFCAKSQGGITAFMFENLFPQTKGSNMKASGDQYIMGMAINRLHKEGLTPYTADELIEMNKKTEVKLNKQYFEEKIGEYKKMVFDLSKEKKLWDWKEGCLKKYFDSPYYLP